MNTPSNSQSGVALMMSVLILAAITAIAFSLTTIVFIELRAARDVVKSEPALYATLGVSEEALFQFKRFVDSSEMDVTQCTPAILNVCELNGVSLTSPLPELLTEAEVPYVKTIFAGDTVELPLFTRNCPEQNPDCVWNPVVGSLSFELVPIGNPTANLKITADWIDRNDGSTGTENIATAINESSVRVDWSLPVLTDRQYILKLQNTHPTQNVQVSIWSYSPTNSQQYVGLPYITSNVLKIVANYSGLTRSYLVEIPFGDLDFGDPTLNDVVWFDDSLPTGAIAGFDGGDSWSWVSSNPNPFSGTLSHQSADVAGVEHQHYFYNASQTMSVNAGETLIAYVYLNPASPPSEVMLQWNNGTWDHRAYWGSNSIDWGADGTEARWYMGALPTPGQWVRLEVPASAVGLEGSVLNGVAFTLFGGQATWDRVGKSQ